MADAYLSALRQRIPDLTVDTLDLSEEKLPEFDGEKVAAKIAVLTGQAHQGRQKTAWDEITEIANRFIEADRYLIAVPMWKKSRHRNRRVAGNRRGLGRGLSRAGRSGGRDLALDQTVRQSTRDGRR